MDLMLETLCMAAQACEPDRVVTEDGRDLAAVLLGQLGGMKGGRARAAVLSSERRSEIAKKAAEARWGKAE